MKTLKHIIITQLYLLCCYNVFNYFSVLTKFLCNLGLRQLKLVELRYTMNSVFAFEVYLDSINYMFCDVTFVILLNWGRISYSISVKLVEFLFEFSRILNSKVFFRFERRVLEIRDLTIAEPKLKLIVL